jgi:hypothetical protein
VSEQHIYNYNPSAARDAKGQLETKGTMTSIKNLFFISHSKDLRDLLLLRHCQLYIKGLLSYGLKMALYNAETCSLYVLLINYILYNKVVLDNKFIYFIHYW